MIAIIPTNTCYGLGCPRDDLEAFERIYELKDRSRSKALALLVENLESVKRYIHVTPAQLADLKSYPYPWSIVGVRREDAPLPNFILSHPLYATLSLRTIQDALPESIQAHITTPYWLTSANKSGESEAHTINEAKEFIASSLFPHEEVQYLDAGICDGLGSNIFSYIGDGLEKTYFRKNYPI